MSETYDDYENWEEERKVNPLSLVVITVMAFTSAAIIGNALLRQPESAGVLIMKDVRNERLNARTNSNAGDTIVAQINNQAMTLTIQNALMIAGYYAGPLDGVEGSQTKEAISAYQDSIGMKVNGKVSQELYDILTRRKELPTGSVVQGQSLASSPTQSNSTPEPGVIKKPEPQPQRAAQELDALPRIKPVASRPSATSARQAVQLEAKPRPVPRQLVVAGTGSA